MDPERTFSGEYPSSFIYVWITVLGIHSVMISVFVIIAITFFQPIVLIALMVFALFLSFAWFSLCRRIKYISFLKDHVSITYCLSRVEIVQYTDLQKYFIKYEGFHKTVSTLQFQTKSKKSKKVSFTTQHLDHPEFKTQLIHLKNKNG